MLEQNLKDQVKTLFAGLKNNYTFLVTVSGSHPNRDELTELLQEVASCSDKVNCQFLEGKDLSFQILKNGQPISILFRTVPTGHEFTSLLLALLNSDGIGKNLPDEITTNRIKSLKGPVLIKSYISLTCTNCPEVVQALNIISLLNPEVSHEIIDGAINQEEANQLNVQAVPSVYVNGKLFHVGRSNLGELLGKLEELVGTDFKMSSKEEKYYDVVVIGGGPAGISAAIYTARKGISVAIIAGNIGGQLTETLAIENMISIPKTTGSALTANLKLHLNEYPVNVFENRKLEKFEIVEGIKHIYTSVGELFKTPAVIIATGASWKKLGVPGESKYIGSGVAFCAHCDGPFYKNKRVAVIGGGNSGLEAAIDLSSIASEVTVLEFLDELKGDQVLQDKLAGLSNVKVFTSAETLSIDGDGNKVTGLQFKDRKNGTVKTIEIEGVFVQIGLKANSHEFKDILSTSKFGEIEIDSHCRTKVPGIYAAGDVSTVPFKQIVIAMGEGAKAALSAFEDKIKGVQVKYQ